MINPRNKDKIVEQIKSFRRRKSSPLIRFSNSCIDCAELEIKVSKLKVRKSIKNLAKKNAIINLITSLEVFLKEVIQVNYSNWNDSGLEDLLKDKISLSNAFDLFSEYIPTKADMISHHYSFQNSEAIANVFNKLTNSNFMDLIGTYRYVFNSEQKKMFKGSDLIFNRDLPSWRITLRDIYDVRHQFVHESTDRLTVEINISTMMIFVIQFGAAIWNISTEKQFK